MEKRGTRTNAGPWVVGETEAYAVLYKPAGLHTAPLKNAAGPEMTLLDWYAGRFPGVRLLRGRLPWEGGLVHRLDRETRGLVLAAKTQAALESFLAQQREGRIEKEYEARARREGGRRLAGFPPPPPFFSAGLPSPPWVIRSRFRAYGPGRRAVRPLPLEAAGDRRPGLPVYETHVSGWSDRGPFRCFQVKLFRGFRHQIRAHLAWLGFPLVNDGLYGGWCEGAEKTPLGLSAWGLSFQDPVSGEPQRYTISC